jgi:hypothetical protein
MQARGRIPPVWVMTYLRQEECDTWDVVDQLASVVVRIRIDCMGQNIFK